MTIYPESRGNPLPRGWRYAANQDRTGAGAGSAKGWAHIGVINALKKLGIEVDIVAGCSVGALVGAAFASHRLPAMEQWVRSFSYWDVIRLMDFSWQRGGLLRGERVFNAVGQLLKINDIAECALKFGAVTTNLSTGRELWLTEGDIHQAVRASCSMPGLLAPVWADGYWLVDGAVVNPVPVSLCRALGADIVIAVDLQHDAHLMQQDLFSVRGEDQSADDAPQAIGAGVCESGLAECGSANRRRRRRRWRLWARRFKCWKIV